MPMIKFLSNMGIDYLGGKRISRQKFTSPAVYFFFLHSCMPVKFYKIVKDTKFIKNLCRLMIFFNFNKYFNKNKKFLIYFCFNLQNWFRISYLRVNKP